MPLRVFLDIETIPPDEKVRERLKPSLIRKLSRKYDSHFQLEQNSAAADSSGENEDCQENCTEEMFRSLSLHAEYGRILCIGIILEKDGAEWRKGVFGYDAKSETFHLDEKKTLRGLWKLLREEFNIRRDLIIGHNLMDFDLPFIYKRSRILKVKPSVQFSFARYRSQPIYDTMREWALWNLREKSISLPHLAELLQIGIGKTDGMDGSKIYDQYLGDNHSLIAEYCLQDVEVTRAVYHQMIASSK